MRRPVYLLDEHSNIVDRAYSVALSANPTRTEDIIMRRPTPDAAPHLSEGNVDSFEIPETPSVTEKM